MKKFFVLIMVLFFLGCDTITTQTDTNETNDTNNTVAMQQRIIIPLYFYDTDKWNHIASYKDIEVVILNPSNGPGDTKDDNYEILIKKLNSNNNKPIGYVYTKWGDRNISEVKNDINKWLNFYPGIKGFFIDETAEKNDKIGYYRDLYLFIKSKGDYYIVLNPGVYPDEEYFALSESVVVFEDSKDKLDTQICEKNSDKSSLIVYDANESQMKEILKKYKCKNVYVTDDTLPNPYDSLPSYFDEEIKLLK